MYKNIIRILGCLVVTVILMNAVPVFMSEVNAALRPYNYLGTVIEKDAEGNTITIEAEYEWGDGWVPCFRILEGTACKDAMDGVNVGDHVEVASLGGSGQWWVALGKISGTERVISDIYGDVAHLISPLLGGYKIEYNNTPNCSTWTGGCNCEAKYTTVNITSESGQTEGHQLYPGQNYAYEGGIYRINITFHSGQAHVYPECTGQPYVGPQAVSDFTIYIEGTGKLEVDVWTDEGGKGHNVPDGTYEIGDSITIYKSVNKDCYAEIYLYPPYGPAIHLPNVVVDGKVIKGFWLLPVDEHTLQEEDLEGVEPTGESGEWEIEFHAWTDDGEEAVDTCVFEVEEPGVVDWDSKDKAREYAPMLTFFKGEPWYPVRFNYDGNWWALDNNEYWDEGIDRDQKLGPITREAVGEEDEWYNGGDGGKSPKVGYGRFQEHQWKQPGTGKTLRELVGDGDELPPCPFTEEGEPPQEYLSPTAYYKVIDNEGDYVVYEYWFYYVYNSYKLHVGPDKHEHDWEGLFVWVDKSTGEPRHLLAGYHILSPNEYDIYDRGYQGDGGNGIYVGLGSHAMALNLMDLSIYERGGYIDTDVTDRVIRPEDWTLVDIDTSELYRHSGCAYDIDGQVFGDDDTELIDGKIGDSPITESPVAAWAYGYDEYDMGALGISTHPATSYPNDEQGKDETFKNYYSFNQIDYYDDSVLFDTTWRMRTEGFWDNKRDGTQENTFPLVGEEEVTGIKLPWAYDEYWNPSEKFGWPTTAKSAFPVDLNRDGVIDYRDLAVLGSVYGTTLTESRFMPAADLSDDGVIDYKDLAILGSKYGQGR